MKRVLGILGYFITISFLLTTNAFAGEKVFFYYTDPAGTPVAMTDANGTVVWRADYKPFGEEQSITGTVENNEKFVGKEKDKETGLYYFGARYMKAEIGRFTSPDPVGPVDAGTSKTSYSLLSNPQNLNRYAYSLNNPYKYLDPNGKWPEWIHNSIINAAFSKGKYKLDQKFIAALKRGSANVDKDQSLESSYKHAMSSPYYDKEHAEKYMNNFIEKKMNEYKTLMSQGNEEAAYFVLGEAMHPIMDSTSPSHTGFQEWRGLDGTIELGEGISHGLQESIIAIDRFRITVNKIKEFYSDIK